MAYIALGLGGVFLLVLLAQGFLSTPPAALARGLRWGGVVVASGLFMFLALSERLAPLLALVGAVLTFALQAGSLWRMWQSARSLFSGGGGASAWGPHAQQSTVETAFLRMTLDLGTGVMEGTVRRGRFAGRRLDELSREELAALWREARADDDPSASLVEAYLDRRFADWRTAGDEADPSGAERRGGVGARTAAMTRDEAYQVLGLAAGASPAEIKEAHRRLMQRLHPDLGGSDWLATRINLAKDLLLKG
jgi:hypothetical protein